MAKPPQYNERFSRNAVIRNLVIRDGEWNRWQPIPTLNRYRLIFQHLFFGKFVQHREQAESKLIFVAKVEQFNLQGQTGEQTHATR